MSKENIINNLEKSSEFNPKVAWSALIIVVLGTFMAMLDQTIVNIAIPTMMKEMAITLGTIKWVLTAYSLTLAAVIPLTSYFEKSFGKKKVYMFAMAIFTLGSILCATAHSPEQLIMFRVLQAIGGGIMAPMGMSIILDNFPVEKRGTAFGVWGVAALAAPAIGPTLGGFLVDSMSWRAIFYVNVPIGIAAFVLSIFLLKGRPFKKFGKFDFLGYSSFLASVVLFVYILGQWNDINWHKALYPVLCVVVVICFIIFLFTETHVKDPVLDLKVFENFTFSYTTVIFAFVMIAMMGVSYSLPLFWQNVKMFTPMHAGEVMLPASLMMGIGMLVSGKLMDKFGLKVVVIPGFIVMSVASYFLAANYTLGVSTGTIILLSCLLYLGISFVMMPINTNMLSTIPKHLNLAATSASNITKQVISSLGITMVTNMITSYSTAHLSSALQGVDPTNKAALAHAGLLNFANSLSYASKITAVLVLVALVLSLFLKHNKIIKDKETELILEPE